MLIDNELRQAIEQEQELRKMVYNLCKNDVEQIIKNKVTDEKRIDAVNDQILNYITDEKFCELHRRLSDYVETFDSELADSYRRVKDMFLDYYYKMDGMHFTKGNIFCPNRTGHECIVCQPVNSKGELCTKLDEQIKELFPEWLFFYEIKLKRIAKVKERLGETYFHSAKTNGFDYNIATLFVKESGDDNITHINLEAFRKAVKEVYVVANPLPARTLTTVRLPYKMGCDLSCEEWEDVCQIILEELAKKGYSRRNMARVGSVRMPKKRITAPFYTETKIGIHNLFRNTRSPEGYLYSKGRYQTGITAEDLPEHYVYGCIFKTLGYISVLGIKDIVYKPNYHINHLHKDDLLFISYDKPIVETKDKFGYDIQEGYEAVLYGHMILDFIRVVRKYQSYDIEPIADEVKKKEAFYREKYPEECSIPGIDWLE